MAKTVYDRCIGCYGSGKMLGGGMLQCDCSQCDGLGKIERIDDELDYLEQVKSAQSYSDAKATLMSKLDIDSAKADELLSEQLVKAEPIIKVKRKRRTPAEMQAARSAESAVEACAA